MARTLLLRLVAAAGAVAIGAAVPAGAQEPPAEEVQVDEVPATDPPEIEDPPPVDEPDPEPPTTVPEVTIPAPTVPDLTLPEVVPPEPPAPGPVAAAAEDIVVQAPPDDVGPPEDAPADPPGNNGTVKVDGGDLDNDPNNEPHVDCAFEIDFYGYDEGDLNATVTFEGVPPTGGGLLLTDSVFIGEDPAGGGTDHDASASYDLSAALAGIPPHAQGHHVKLTVNAEGSQGADVKHKVFWVSDCSTTTTTTPPTTTPPTTAPPTTEPPPPSTVPPPATVPPATAPPPAGPEPEIHAAGPVAIPVAEEIRAEEQRLPTTGSDVYELVVGALVLLAIGGAVLWVARRITT